jgi:hypothetical protein
MFFSKTVAFSVFVIAIGGSFWGAAPAVSGESSQKESYSRFLPLKSISYEFGSKAMSGYFVQEGEVCLATLLIIEKIDPDRLLPLTAARVRLMLNPGQITGLDSEEGGSLNITCGAGAATVTVDYAERSKLVARQGIAVRNTVVDHVQSQASPQKEPACLYYTVQKM